MGLVLEAGEGRVGVRYRECGVGGAKHFGEVRVSEK